MIGGQTERSNHVDTRRPLHRDDAQGGVLIGDRHAHGSGLAHDAEHCRGVRGVRDDEDLVIGDPVHDEIVDHTTRGIAQHRVLRFTDPDPAQIIGQ